MLHQTLAIAAAALALMASAHPAAAARSFGGIHGAAPRTNFTARTTTFKRPPQGPLLRREHATVERHPGRGEHATSWHQNHPVRHAVNTCGDGRCPPKKPPGTVTGCRRGECGHPPGGTVECRYGKCPPPKPPGGITQCGDRRCPPRWPPHPYPLPPGGTVIGLPSGPGVPGGTGTSATGTTAYGTPSSTSTQSGNNSPPNNPTPINRNSPIPRLGFDVPPANERRYRPDEVLLDMGPTASPESLDAMIRRHRLTRLESYRIRLTGRTLHRLHIPDGRAVPEVIADLAGDPRIVAAQPNYLFALEGETRSLSATAESAAADEDSTQYVVSKLRLAEAHRLATGKRVTVALIDTGVDVSHPYLSGSIAGTFNALGGDDTADEHGTAMAGAIVEHGDLIGVAPGARLLSVRAFDARSERTRDATSLAIIQGLDWAVEHGARVVNMSFAGPRATFIEDPIAAAYGRNVVLIAAAGNDGPRAAPAYPGALPQVIAVTATDADDRLFDHANHGRYIAVAAPGVDVVAPILDSAVKTETGTSIAAAHVSGVAALLIERNPSLRPEDIKRILMATAVKPDANARVDEFGAGRVDAFAAVRSLGPGAVSDSSAQVRMR